MSLAARRFVFLTAAVLVMAAACVGRVLFEGRRSLEATAQLRETDRRAAIVQARRAAAWYVPFASHVDEAYRELRSLALAAEREGDRETALMAWRAIRSASMTTRWLVEPHRREREEADAALARLAAEGSRGASGELSARDLERIHASALAREEAPRTGWVLVLLLGTVAWFGGVAWFARDGLTREGRLVPKAAALPALVAVLGFGLFATALWLL